MKASDRLAQRESCDKAQHSKANNRLTLGHTALVAFFIAICACFIHAPPSSHAADKKSAEVNFIRDIKPLLAANCYQCHGPDEKKRKGDLRLDRRADAFRETDGERLIAAGNAAKSEFFRRLATNDKSERMPPAKSGRKLSTEQIELFKRWIDQGATWQKHWAFESLARSALPDVKDDVWPRTDIDRFVLARLEQEGLQPAPRATGETLIRRLSFDLTGLPPTLEQVDEYLNDSSPDAYENLVDRMLKSPAYGERWARVWLDLARYADTKGYEKDRQRTIWRYRDWVIDAFNGDMPFDQFTIEQIAGDLLPKPTTDQLLATAFHRNTMVNEEGGTDDEEFRVAAVKDRVDTTVQVWMGLTMGCGKCHSHKYDPITQREYYQFLAFFNQTQDSDKGNDFPVLATPTQEQEAQQAKLKKQIATLNDQVRKPTPQLEAEARKWEEAVKSAGGAAKRKPSIPKLVLAIVHTPAEKRTKAQQQQLLEFYSSIAPSTAALRKQIAKQQKQLAAIKPPMTPIMRELSTDKQRTTHIHIRGNFLAKGDAVEPAVLASFHPLADGQPRNRLSVARWLIDRNNPLTARVMVNRFWAQFFGIGIVETEEDFGSQGLPPSHPRLLDWLATEFMRQDWSMKQLCKTIVMSATYQQSSRLTADVLQRDRFNRLLARGPRIRLDAEMVRDNALAVSGLLSRKIHGPSVMPPQPAGIWQSTYNTQKWVTSSGEDRYRRGIYTFLKRTSPYPSMVTFDAPSREVCTVRRISTNTPLQALVLLNDPVYVEAAQALARRVVKQAGNEPKACAELAFRLALARKPSPKELERITDLYQRRLAFYRGDKAAAKLIATVPLGPLPDGWDVSQLAAWSTVCNAILNLDELVTKG